MFSFLRIGIFRHRGPKGGVPLWQSRGYNSPDQMTNEIIDVTNSVVRSHDYLFYMGDWCLNTNEKEFEDDLDRINCQNIMMLWGNHNNPIHRVYDREVAKVAHKINGDIKWYGEPEKDQKLVDTNWMGKVEIYPFRYKNVVFCGDYMEVIVDKQYFCMMHYPIDVFNEMRHGAYMLCGHSHYSYEKTRAEFPENKRLDVSWDGHMKPLSFSEIVQIMSNKQLKSMDHH